MVCTGTLSGYPARNIAMRASVARCDPPPSTDPTTMSPTSAGSIFVRTRVSFRTAASISSTGVS